MQDLSLKYTSNVEKAIFATKFGKKGLTVVSVLPVNMSHFPLYDLRKGDEQKSTQKILFST